MNIHEEHYDVLVRTPMICQNGHQRWLYHLIRRGVLRTLWGPRECDCDCPTGEVDEGFAASGSSQAVLEEVGATDVVCQEKPGFMQRSITDKW